jgi:hypothetical protein
VFQDCGAHAWLCVLMTGFWTLYKRKEVLEDWHLPEREANKHNWVCTFFTVACLFSCLVCWWKCCTTRDKPVNYFPFLTSETSSSRSPGSLGHRLMAPTSLETHSLSPPPLSYKSSPGSAAQNTPNGMHFSIAYPQPSPLPKPNGKETLNMFSYWKTECYLGGQTLVKYCRCKVCPHGMTTTGHEGALWSL